MSEKPDRSENLDESFRRLGKNLRNLAEDAWDSEERRAFTQEIEDSLSEIGAALDNAANKVLEHPETQRLKEEVNEFGERVRSGAFTEDLKREMREAVDEINTRVEGMRADLRGEPPAPADDEGSED